jgi:hypothetical protein
MSLFIQIYHAMFDWNLTHKQMPKEQAMRHAILTAYYTKKYED